MQPRTAVPSILLLLLISLLSALSSCGGVDTSVTAVYPRVIIAYESAETEPDIFLSLYGEVHGNALRLESMTITHKDSGMFWSTDRLEVISGSDGHTTYAGYPTFRPYEKTFPTGMYTVSWYEKNGRHFTIDFSLGSQTPELPQEADTVRTVMVEDADRRVLYAGQSNRDFFSNRTIRSKYPTAALYRKYVLKSNTRVMYVYPPVYVRNDSDND